MDYQMLLLLAAAAVPLAVAIWAIFVRQPAAVATTTVRPKPSQPPPVRQKAQQKQKHKQRNSTSRNNVNVPSYNYANLRGHTAQLCDAAISPSGKYLASSAEAVATASFFATNQKSSQKQHHRKPARHSFGGLHSVAVVQQQIATSMTCAQRQAALSPPLREYTKLNWSVWQLALCLGEKYCLSVSDQLKWGYPMRQDSRQIIFYSEEWRDGQLVSSLVPASVTAADQSLAVVVSTTSSTPSSPGFNVNARAFVSSKTGKNANTSPFISNKAGKNVNAAPFISTKAGENENACPFVSNKAGKNVNARVFVSKRTSDVYIVNEEDGLLAAKQVARRDSCDSTTSGDSGQESVGSLSPSMSTASATVSSTSNSSGDEDLDSCSSYSSGTWSVTTGRSLEDIPSASAKHMAQPSPSTAAATTAVVPIDDRHTCSRCTSKFRYQHSMITGKRVPTVCRWHSGRLLRIDERMQYVCCKKPTDHLGCERATQHVWSGRNGGLNGPFAANAYVETAEPDETNTTQSENAILALDAEMVFTEQGMELAKISVVRHNGQLVYEQLVRPTADIVDYNTRYSGITEAQMNCRTVRNLSQVQQDLLAIISARTILVGHALNNDLRCLRILHGRVVDTAIVFPHFKGHPYRNALRTLVKENLQRSIQVEGESHDSFEDARSSLALLLFHVRRHHAVSQ